MNILIKLMSIVSLVIAPSIASIHADSIQKNRMEHLKASMQACKKAGCTEAQCAEVMGSSACATPAEGDGKKACCSGEEHHAEGTAATTEAAPVASPNATEESPSATEDPHAGHSH